MTTVKIERDVDIYCHYEGQTNAQPAEIVLECESGRLVARYNPEIGNAVSGHRWHGRECAWDLDNSLSDAAVIEILEEIKPLCQEILDGYECVWNGSNNIGRLDDRATECDTHLVPDTINKMTAAAAANGDVVVHWDADEFYAYAGCHADMVKRMLLGGEESVLAVIAEDESDFNEGELDLTGVSDYIDTLEEICGWIRTAVADGDEYHNDFVISEDDFADYKKSVGVKS